ncbi:uncharacterized protein [Montipora capricornis]|uniref:uncharacterized protein n=1 Tax=Montipora capricornis TaxID=246305 RepID=UPI0035F168EF
MQAKPCFSSLLSFCWKWKFWLLIALHLLLILQILAFSNFSLAIKLRIITLWQISSESETPDSTSSRSITALPEEIGKLNLHLWFEICTKDLNALCNFPLFPKAPDIRTFAMAASSLDASDRFGTNADAFRLFGFVTPKESGFYSFMVIYCEAEIWIGQNEARSNATMVFKNERLSTEKTNSTVCIEINLKAITKYYFEVVGSCHDKQNELKLYWKTPKDAAFRTIDRRILSYYYNDSGSEHSKIYDETLPGSPACASKRHQKPYFHDQSETTYLAHDEVKDILPYYNYKPSYTMEKKIGRYEAVTYHVVHTYLFPFPEHPKLQDDKYWIFPLEKEEALEITDLFMEYLDKAKPRIFNLEEILSVERKIDKKYGKRYLLDVKLRDLTANKSVVLSEYVFMPTNSNQLYYPANFQWEARTPIYLVVTAKNLGRWLHHFIMNVETILEETQDPNLQVIICDYNSNDINLEEVLRRSSLRNYTVLKKSGDYSRATAFSEAINLVRDPHSIVFLMDLHLDIASSLINSIRKHCIEGRMFYTPIIVELDCGASPANLAGIWQGDGSTWYYLRQFCEILALKGARRNSAFFSQQ